MNLRREKREKARNRRGSSRLSKIRRILRTVPDNKAFYFYEGEGKPCTQVAKSLQEFCDKINTVPQSSLVFHLKRKDFGNWFTQIIEDSVLAKRIGKINVKNLDLKLKLYSTVNNRIRELKDVPSLRRRTSEDLSTTATDAHTMPGVQSPQV